MALLHARGQISAGQPFYGYSIIDSRFDCRIVGQTTVGDRPAIIPEIAGRAWITGTQQVMLDPDDPWPAGYRLADTWPRVGGADNFTSRGRRRDDEDHQRIHYICYLGRCGEELYDRLGIA